MQYRVDGEPVAKQRPRVVGNHAFTPKQTRDWEERAAMYFASQRHEARASCFSVPVAVSIVVARNKSRGDLDNYCKSILDAAVRAGAISDDKYVLQLTAKIVEKSAQPYVALEVVELAPVACDNAEHEQALLRSAHDDPQ